MRAAASPWTSRSDSDDTGNTSESSTCLTFKRRTSQRNKGVSIVSNHSYRKPPSTNRSTFVIRLKAHSIVEAIIKRPHHLVETWQKIPGNQWLSLKEDSQEASEGTNIQHFSPERRVIATSAPPVFREAATARVHPKFKKQVVHLSAPSLRRSNKYEMASLNVSLSKVPDEQNAHAVVASRRIADLLESSAHMWSSLFSDSSSWEFSQSDIKECVQPEAVKQTLEWLQEEIIDRMTLSPTTTTTQSFNGELNDYFYQEVTKEQLKKQDSSSSGSSKLIEDAILNTADSLEKGQLNGNTNTNMDKLITELAHAIESASPLQMFASEKASESPPTIPLFNISSVKSPLTLLMYEASEKLGKLPTRTTGIEVSVEKKFPKFEGFIITFPLQQLVRCRTQKLLSSIDRYILLRSNIQADVLVEKSKVNFIQQVVGQIYPPRRYQTSVCLQQQYRRKTSVTTTPIPPPRWNRCLNRLKRLEKQIGKASEKQPAYQHIPGIPVRPPRPKHMLYKDQGIFKSVKVTASRTGDFKFTSHQRPLKYHISVQKTVLEPENKTVAVGYHIMSPSKTESTKCTAYIPEVNSVSLTTKTENKFVSEKLVRQTFRSKIEVTVVDQQYATAMKYITAEDIEMTECDIFIDKELEHEINEVKIVQPQTEKSVKDVGSPEYEVYSMEFQLKNDASELEAEKICFAANNERIEEQVYAALYSVIFREANLEKKSHHGFTAKENFCFDIQKIAFSSKESEETQILAAVKLEKKHLIDPNQTHLFNYRTSSELLKINMSLHEDVQVSTECINWFVKQSDDCFIHEVISPRIESDVCLKLCIGEPTLETVTISAENAKKSEDETCTKHINEVDTRKLIFIGVETRETDLLSDEILESERESESSDDCIVPLITVVSGPSITCTLDKVQETGSMKVSKQPDLSRTGRRHSLKTELDPIRESMEWEVEEAPSDESAMLVEKSELSVENKCETISLAASGSTTTTEDGGESTDTISVSSFDTESIASDQLKSYPVIQNPYAELMRSSEELSNDAEVTELVNIEQNAVNENAVLTIFKYLIEKVKVDIYSSFTKSIDTTTTANREKIEMTNILEDKDESTITSTASLTNTKVAKEKVSIILPKKELVTLNASYDNNNVSEALAEILPANWDDLDNESFMISEQKAITEMDVGLIKPRAGKRAFFCLDPRERQKYFQKVHFITKSVNSDLKAENVSKELVAVIIEIPSATVSHRIALEESVHDIIIEVQSEFERTLHALADVPVETAFTSLETTRDAELAKSDTSSETTSTVTMSTSFESASAAFIGTSTKLSMDENEYNRDQLVAYDVAFSMMVSDALIEKPLTPSPTQFSQVMEDLNVLQSSWSKETDSAANVTKFFELESIAKRKQTMNITVCANDFDEIIRSICLFEMTKADFDIVASFHKGATIVLPGHNFERTILSIFMVTPPMSADMSPTRGLTGGMTTTTTDHDTTTTFTETEDEDDYVQTFHIECGTTATISCELMTYVDSENLIWYKDGIPITDMHRCQRETAGLKESLMVHHAVPNDGGLYSVLLQGELYPVARLIIRPPVTRQPETCFAMEGQTARISFQFPAAYSSVQWYYEDSEIEMSLRHQMIADGNWQHLIIPNAIPEDQGLYTAVAGATSFSTQLIVEGNHVFF